MSKSNGWIPVTKGIPKLGEVILVNYEDGTMWLDFLSINKFFGESENHGKVVAWMPLPEPYQVKGDTKNELG